MFLPTQAIHRGDSMDWNSLVSDALLLLEADEQNQFWKSMWISILARLAKHDHQGAGQGWPSQMAVHEVDKMWTLACLAKPDYRGVLQVLPCVLFLSWECVDSVDRDIL